MTMPDTHAALAAALAAVQAELPEVKKTRTADVNNKEGRFLYSYSYADLSDASAAILPLLGKHGLAFTAFPGHQPDGKFGLRYWLLHSDGGSIEGFFEIGDQGGMQMVGGRITYARRYCLCAVTGIAAEDDVDARDDGNSNGRKAQRRQQPVADRGEQPQGTAQRRPRPAPERTAPSGDLPPLPGEDEDPTTSGASSSARAPASGSPARNGGQSPSTPDGSASGRADEPVTNRQLTAIWTILTKEFAFDDSEKDQARMICGHIIRREVPTTTGLTLGEGKTILDTLGHWLHQARQANEEPRAYLIAVMTREEEARRQQDADGEVPGNGE